MSQAFAGPVLGFGSRLDVATELSAGIAIAARVANSIVVNVNDGDFFGREVATSRFHLGMRVLFHSRRVPLGRSLIRIVANVGSLPNAELLMDSERLMDSNVL